MEKEASSTGHEEKAETEASPSLGTGSSSSVGRPKKEYTPEETRVAWKFLHAAMKDAMQYSDMEEEEEEDKYRRAGKLHKYDPENEWMKRLARVARKYPRPDGFMPFVDDCLKLLDDEEED